MRLSILLPFVAAGIAVNASPLPEISSVISPLVKRFQSSSPWIWGGDAGEALDKRAPKELEKRFQSYSPWIWGGDAGEALDKREPKELEE